MQFNLFSTPIRAIDGIIGGDKLEIIADAVAQYKQRIVNDPKFDKTNAMYRPLMTNVIVKNVCDHVNQLHIVTEAIERAVIDYASELTGQRIDRVDISHAWLAYQGSGHYVQRHNHTFVTDPSNSVHVIDINAIFYIQVFEQETLDLYYPHQNMVITSGTKSLSGMVAGAVPCRSNRLVLIPSWLDHSVNARPRQQDKICLSINYKVIR